MAKKAARQATKAKRTTASPTPSAGELWAIPVPGLGYTPIVIARAPSGDVDYAFVYLQPTLEKTLPKSVPPLQKWTSAWMGMVPTLPFRKERWKRCGSIQGFKREEWPVPPSRASMVVESEPVEKWGQYPWGEMWSIETTPDEPTMLVISNTPATRQEALRFPKFNIVCAASYLEKGLVQFFKKRRAGGWDMDFHPQPIAPDLVELWTKHPTATRADWPGTPPEWYPAGTKTDRNLKAGAWMAHPLSGGGFGASILIDKPDPHQRIFSDAVVMGMRRRWDRWPTLNDVTSLTPEDGAYICQTSMISVRDGRWRVLGEHPNFDPKQWVWPHPWWQDVEQRKNKVISIRISSGESFEVKPDPAILALDPIAGERCRGSSGYAGIESEIARVINATSPYLVDSTVTFPRAIVTPSKLKAWRALNAIIEDALAKRSQSSKKRPPSK